MFPIYVPRNFFCCSNVGEYVWKAFMSIYWHKSFSNMQSFHSQQLALDEGIVEVAFKFSFVVLLAQFFCRQILLLTERYASILGQCFHSQVCLGELKGNAEVVFQMFFLIFTAPIKFSAFSKNMAHFFIWSLIILLNIWYRILNIYIDYWVSMHLLRL